MHRLACTCAPLIESKRCVQPVWWAAQVYAVSAVGGTALSYIMSPNPSVGASGEPGNCVHASSCESCGTRDSRALLAVLWLVMTGALCLYC